MSRLIQEDFSKVFEFLETYKIRQNVLNASVDNMKEMHKKMYALLVFDAEICNKSSLYQSEKNYLKETLSDIVTSFFSWSNGLYKPAAMSLRSSIENILKSLIYRTNNNIINEKSVYKIFEEARDSSSFQSPIQQTHVSILSDSYSKLCEVVHSGETKLISVSSLGFFPKYNEVQANEFKTLFIKTTKSILALLYFTYHKEIQYIDEHNKNSFLQSLDKSIKSSVNEYYYE